MLYRNYKESLSKDKDALIAYNNALGENIPWRKAFEEHLSNASESAKKWPERPMVLQINALPDANDERQRTIDLEKAQAELEHAKT